MFGNFGLACNAFSGAFKNFLPRIDDQSITVKPFSDGIDVFSFTGQRSDVGPSEYAPGHLNIAIWRHVVKVDQRHFPSFSHDFPMISHVILHLHIIFPQTNLPKSPPKPSLRQAFAKPSPRSRCLSEFFLHPWRCWSISMSWAIRTWRRGYRITWMNVSVPWRTTRRWLHGCGDPGGMIFIGGDTPIARWMVYWCLFHGKFYVLIDDLEAPPFHETSIYDIQLM